MADLKDYTIYKNNRYQILTNQGYKDFDGIIIGQNNNKIILEFERKSIKTKIICTPKHKLHIDKKEIVYAKDVNIGDVLWNGVTVKSKKEITNNETVYDILNVHDTHNYIVNKEILSKNCLIIDEMAHIADHIINEFWTAVIPVVSSALTTKVFVVSTPNGTGNLFHQIYTQAERGELDQWHHERIDWWEIPGRGKKWKRSMEQALVAKGLSFDQEFGNCTSSDTLVNIQSQQYTDTQKINMEKLWEILDKE